MENSEPKLFQLVSFVRGDFLPQKKRYRKLLHQQSPRALYAYGELLEVASWIALATDLGLFAYPDTLAFFRAEQQTLLPPDQLQNEGIRRVAANPRAEQLTRGNFDGVLGSPDQPSTHGELKQSAQSGWLLARRFSPDPVLRRFTEALVVGEQGTWRSGVESARVLAERISQPGLNESFGEDDAWLVDGAIRFVTHVVDFGIWSDSLSLDTDDPLAVPQGIGQAQRWRLDTDYPGVRQKVEAAFESVDWVVAQVELIEGLETPETWLNGFAHLARSALVTWDDLSALHPEPAPVSV